MRGVFFLSGVQLWENMKGKVLGKVVVEERWSFIRGSTLSKDTRFPRKSLRSVFS